MCWVPGTNDLCNIIFAILFKSLQNIPWISFLKPRGEKTLMYIGCSIISGLIYSSLHLVRSMVRGSDRCGKCSSYRGHTSFTAVFIWALLCLMRYKITWCSIYFKLIHHLNRTNMGKIWRILRKRTSLHQPHKVRIQTLFGEKMLIKRDKVSNPVIINHKKWTGQHSIIGNICLESHSGLAKLKIVSHTIY